MTTLKRIDPPKQETPDWEYEPLKFGKVEILISREASGSHAGYWHLFPRIISEFTPDLDAALNAMAEKFQVAADGLRAMAAEETEARDELTKPAFQEATS